MISRLRLSVALTIALLIAIAANHATAEPLADPAGRLAEAVAYVDGLSSFTVDMTMEFVLEQKDGKTDDVSLTATLAFDGEDNARFRVVMPDDTLELIASKENTFLYLGKQKQYIEGDVLGARLKALTAMPAGPFRGAQMMFSDFIHGASSFQESIDTAEVTALDSGLFPDCDGISVNGSDLVTDFWIQQGDTPLLRQFTLDLTTIAQQSSANMQSAKVIYSFENWNTKPELAADHFAFVIPEGATKYAPQQMEQPADALVGQPAPNIVAPLLSEGTLDLASHKGKNVVILDFWASWCGPCRIGLPIVTRVAEQFKEKGVVLYAVNIGEDKGTAQAFVEQSGLTATVALDQNRTAQRDYQANSIPKTVIIDKDGIIREVHTGVIPTLEEDLTKLLTELTE